MNTYNPKITTIEELREYLQQSIKKCEEAMDNVLISTRDRGSHNYLLPYGARRAYNHILEVAKNIGEN